MSSAIASGLRSILPEPTQQPFDEDITANQDQQSRALQDWFKICMKILSSLTLIYWFHIFYQPR